MACIRFRLQGRELQKEESESCLSCMGHASSSFLPNIIKICLRVSKLWSAQDFDFRAGNYIMKKVSFSLACDIPTGPPLDFYKTSKYVLGYQYYGVHKILASGEIAT